MYSLRLPAGVRPPVDGALGRLEMRWRQVGTRRLLHCLCALSRLLQSMGESGSLHTVVNMQQFKQPEPPAVDLTLALADAASVFVEQPFDLIVTLKNRGSAPLVNARLLLPCNTEASIIPLGLTELPVPTVAPRRLHVANGADAACGAGLREITGVCVLDDAAGSSYQVSACACAGPRNCFFRVGAFVAPPSSLTPRCRCLRRCL